MFAGKTGWRREPMVRRPSPFSADSDIRSKLVPFAMAARLYSGTERRLEVPVMNNERGATILETALVLPVFFLLLLAIFEFGLVYSAYQSMVGGVREGARYAAATNANLGSPSAAQVA